MAAVSGLAQSPAERIDDLITASNRSLAEARAARAEAARLRLLVADHERRIVDLLRERNEAVATAAELQADKARLDFLDGMNAALNRRSGTHYGWTLILNHNVNRLMLGHLEVDLNDSEGGVAKLPSCRAAIDREASRITRERLQAQPPPALPQTDAEIRELLRKAAGRRMTPAEREAQRLSWVIGEMMLEHPDWSREFAESLVRETLGLPKAEARP